MDRLAVIDLGSNTFHLLIVEKQSDFPFFRELYKKREYIYLASQGKNKISDEKVNVAIQCLSSFLSVIHDFDCSQVVALATAAIRSADNGKAILDRIKSETGLSVELISGEREAELIYKGTLCLGRTFEDNGMIMDIGGGSVEFIVLEKDQLLFSRSYNIGISFIRKQFDFSEPATENEIHTFYNFLDEELFELLTFVQNKKIKTLIGSSGSFEIVEALNSRNPSAYGNEFDVSDVSWICDIVLRSNKDQRYAIDNMPEARADLSKEAFILIKYFILKLIDLQRLVVSPFALKEGIIREKMIEWN